MAEATIEAPERADPRRGRILGATSIAHFVNDGTAFFVPVIAALLIPIRGFSPLEVTTLFVVYYASSALLGLGVGWWADRRGRPASLMAVGMGLLALGLLLFELVLVDAGGPFDFALSLVAALVTGFATSFYHPLGATLLQRAFPPNERGTALGVNGSFGSLGRALYPLVLFLVSLELVTTLSFVPFVVVGALAAIVVVLTTRSLTAPERAASRTSPRPASESLTRGIVALTIVAFVRSIATQGVAVWIPTFLTQERGIPATGFLGLVVAGMYFGGIFGQLFFGWAANRSDVRYLLALSSAGAAGSTLLYVVIVGPLSWIWFFGIGFFTFSTFPLLMSLSADYVPHRSSSFANAVVFELGAGGGGVIGPLLVGAIAAASYTLLPLGFEAMVGIGLAAAAMALFLPPTLARRGRGIAP